MNLEQTKSLKTSKRLYSPEPEIRYAIDVKASLPQICTTMCYITLKDCEKGYVADVVSPSVKVFKHLPDAIQYLTTFYNGLYQDVTAKIAHYQTLHSVNSKGFMKSGIKNPFTNTLKSLYAYLASIEHAIKCLMDADAIKDYPEVFSMYCYEIDYLGELKQTSILKDVNFASLVSNEEDDCKLVYSDENNFS